jgi:flagellar biosynthesis protein FlhA
MLSRLQTIRDYIFPLAIVACVMVMFVPLPAPVMDVLLAGNIALAAIVLLTTIYVKSPLEFSVFPVMLVSTVLMRLVLNIATTRLILTRGDSDGLAAAGQVVQTFGEFVAGDRLEVGIILFLIIFVIQFVVITKGATRISEVAARFSLDGMPGRQMAIDADLNAGSIDKEEAQLRRELLSRQSDFYGAMDGASKFVRGDAIAGVIITIINLVGGWYIGFAYANYTFSESAAIFSKLTIGDGLVSQIPALLISIAAALLMTRGSQQLNLPSQFIQQIFSNPQVLAVAGFFLAALVLTDLPKIPLSVLGSGCVGLAVILRRNQKTRETAERTLQAEEQAAKSKPPEKSVEEFLTVDTMRVELGSKLISLADPKHGGDLLSRLATVRAWLANDLGILLPMVRVKDRSSLSPNAYEICLHGNRIAIGEIQPGRLLATDNGNTTGVIDGETATNPATGEPAVWIDLALEQQAAIYGYTLQRPSAVLASHVQAVAQKFASELLTRDATKQLIDQLRRTAPALVDELVPSQFKLSEIQFILQSLLQEDIPIRQLGVILEAMGDAALRTSSPLAQIEHVRTKLARSISHRFREKDGRLHVVTLDASIESQIHTGYEILDSGANIRLSPAILDVIVLQIRRELKQLKRAGHRPVLLVNPQVRKSAQAVIHENIPEAIVLSYNEVTRDTVVESHGVVGKTKQLSRAG